MNQEEIVRPDGQIRVMHKEGVLVVGMTAADLSRFLVEHTSHRLHDSEVIVDRFRSSKTTVYVGGEVGRSGAVPCREGLSPLIQPVLVAGGFRESARLESIILVRAQG